MRFYILLTRKDGAIKPVMCLREYQYNTKGQEQMEEEIKAILDTDTESTIIPIEIPDETVDMYFEKRPNQ